MATEYLSVLHTASKTVYFRFYDPAQDKLFDFDDNTWQAAPVNAKLAATEKTAMGDADESLYVAALDLSLLNSTATPMNVTAQAVEDLATDEIIGQSEMTVVSSLAVARSYVSSKGVLNDLAAGAEMDLVDAPNATAITAIQAGLSTFDGTGATLDAAYDAAKTAAQPSDVTTAHGTTDGLIAGLNDVSTADVLAQAGAALTSYDPPTKTEMDNALAALNDPTAASIADAVWDEALAGHVVAGSAGAALSDTAGVFGDGSVTVDADYGGANVLAYLTGAGAGIDNAIVRVFTTADYDAGNRSAAFIQAWVRTTVSGVFEHDIYLDPGDYTFVYEKQGIYGPDTKEVTVT